MTIDIDVNKYFKRIDQAKIFPLLLDKCKELAINTVVRGKAYYAISGFRDPIEQDKLYAIGRTEKQDHPTVTNAAGFKSYHNYGLAIDFCWDKDQKREGLQPSWDVKEYTVLAEEAAKIGLFSGMKFKMVDAPHIQIPLNVIGLTKLEELYKAGGLQACWDEVMKVMANSNVFKNQWVKS
jgi:peptidoglycan L-alanyl-D-glutamate endopeptidase CwlK